MNKDYLIFRRNASIKSKGSSSNEIYLALMNQIHSPPNAILDIGCGQGYLLQLLKTRFPQANLTGTDLTNFSDSNYTFIEHDLNQNMESHFSTYDLICALEVIEHIENPRHFIRQIANQLKSKGLAIISTPNPTSFLSILTFFFKGFHNAFGPKNYPAHITPVTPYQLSNIIEEIDELRIVSIKYLNNGRIPATALKWRQLLPFLRGNRFSDNYMITLAKK